MAAFLKHSFHAAVFLICDALFLYVCYFLHREGFAFVPGFPVLFGGYLCIKYGALIHLSRRSVLIFFPSAFAFTAVGWLLFWQAVTSEPCFAGVPDLEDQIQFAGLLGIVSAICLTIARFFMNGVWRIVDLVHQRASLQQR